MTEFKSGQRVHVKLEYDGVIDNSILSITSDRVYVRTKEPIAGMSGRFIPADSVTLLGPENWPPQVGDIWEADGIEYVTRYSSVDGEYITSIDGRDAPTFFTRKPTYNYKGYDDFKKLNPTLIRRRGKK